MPPVRAGLSSRAEVLRGVRYALAGASQAKPYAVLKDENEALRRSRTEAREQQTATAEILRVISESPTNVQPVFETIVRSALRLLGGHSAGLRSLRGNQLHIAAFTRTTTEGDTALARGPVSVVEVSRSEHFTRLVEDRRPTSIEDTEK